MADDTHDPSEDASEFRCLVPFPDQSPSFVHGFEAGMIWQQMVAGASVIEPPIAVHSANAEVYRRMAAAQGYDCEIEPCEGPDDVWSMLKFEKRRHRFSVIDGGANG